MSIVAEIQEAILALPKSDYVQLWRWLDERDWGVWDAEIAAVSDGGKLEFLAREALEAKQQGRLREL